MFIAKDIKRRLIDGVGKKGRTALLHPQSSQGGHEKVGENWCGHVGWAVTMSIFTLQVYATDTSRLNRLFLGNYNVQLPSFLRNGSELTLVMLLVVKFLNRWSIMQSCKLGF